MAKKTQASPKPGEHPLMSNRSLRSMYAGLASVRAVLSTRRQTAPVRAALKDSACWVAPLEGLTAMDLALGCRTDGLLEHLRPKSSAHLPVLKPLQRLYGAIGAAMSSTGKLPQPAIVAFFERHEIDSRDWPEALQRAASLPLLLVVLPRWKGREDTVELGKLARSSNVPAIPVDAQDAIALYRVSQESLGRARAGGGAAMIEAVHLDDSPPAIDKLAEYLTRRGVASPSWIARNGSNFPDSKAKRE
jgi:hypothetical protein